MLPLTSLFPHDCSGRGAELKLVKIATALITSNEDGYCVENNCVHE